jgi:hypothetical protein
MLSKMTAYRWRCSASALCVHLLQICNEGERQQANGDRGQ